MAYTPQNLQTLLISGINEIEAKYTHSAHKPLLTFLKAFLNFINESKDFISEEVLIEIATGAYLFCRRAVMDEYSTDDNYPYDPIYSEGSLLSFGSQFYTLTNKTLGIDEKNPIDRKTELFYLEKFYTYFDREIDNEKASIKNRQDQILLTALESNHVHVPKLKKILDKTISLRLKNLHHFILPLSKLIPTECEVASALENFTTLSVQEDSFINEFTMFNNKPLSTDKKEFIEQLGVAIAAHVPREQKEEKTPHTRANQIMMGYLWWVINLTTDKHKRSCQNSRDLYAKACLALHILDAHDIHSFMQDTRMQKNYLRAFKSFIGDYNVREKLDDYGRKNFSNNKLINIDNKLDKGKKQIEEIIETLTKKEEASLTQKFPTTILLSDLMNEISKLTSPLSLAAGATLGYMAHQTVNASLLTQFLAQFINNTGIWFVGAAGGLLGYFIADLATKIAFMLAAALLLYYIAKGTMIFLGGTVGVVIDVSADLVKECYDRLMEALKIKLKDPHVEELMESETEAKFVHSLLKFPEALYKDYPDDWQRIHLTPPLGFKYDNDIPENLFNMANFKFDKLDSSINPYSESLLDSLELFKVDEYKSPALTYSMS